MNCMMSCLVMRPPSPVPETCERLTPCSRAILRTSGEERASSSSSWVEVAGAGWGGGVGAAAFFSSFAAGAGLHGRWSGCSFAIDGDCADYRVHAYGRALSNFDLAQNTRCRGGNFSIYLVGRNFEQGFIALDFVAGLFEPFGNSAFNDGFSHLGHDDVSWHDFLPWGHGPQKRAGRKRIL